MAQITVQAETAVLGLRPGEVEVVEDTAYVRKVIAGGRLSLVCTDDAAASPPAPTAKRRRRDEPAVDGAADVEPAVDVEPAAADGPPDPGAA